RYALVLSDVHMPHMDGYEMVRAIRDEEAREGKPHTPVIALTAAALKGEAERCLAAGMDEYLAKPVSIPELVAALRRWLPHTVPLAGDMKAARSEEHTSELQSRDNLVCRLLLEKQNRWTAPHDPDG